MADDDDANDALDDDGAAASIDGDDLYFEGENATENYVNSNDDDWYYSATHTTSWLDNLLNDTAASQGNGRLTPVEDINPDNVFATLVFNSIVFVLLIVLYELLKRWIPSVYSQRLINEKQSYANGDGCNPAGMVESGVKGQLARTSNNKTSAKSPSKLRVEGSVTNGKSKEDGDEKNEGGLGRTEIKRPTCPEIKLDQCAANTQEGEMCTSIRESINEREIHSWAAKCLNKAFSFPVLKWCIPIYKTPWSTFRDLAGLDAYFYLRYIRMCLKITTVSSFWAVIILCPVYATGGGNQSGFYYFSMANILQDDKGRVWVPTFFCWAFTMYCFFCVRSEMIHFVELRMEFLGGEEEDQIFHKRKTMGGRTRPSNGSERPRGSSKEDADENGTSIAKESDERRSRYRSPPLPGEEGPDRTYITTVSREIQTSPDTQLRKQMKQHRYSLQVEKVPPDLRSNTALFDYFNEMFPNQVHSACIAMNVPDLDALSARRLRVRRRLEKSLAYCGATGIRPTHVAGRPRCRCCGIESTPVEGWCVVCCFVYDSCKMRSHLDDDDWDHPTDVYDVLPDKGERVDSILYYTRDLANCNLKMEKLQEEKFLIAETGNPLQSGIGDAADESTSDWYAQPLGMLKTTAAMAAEGLREEFEVFGEEDYLGEGIMNCGLGYGSTTITYSSSSDDKAVAPSSPRQQIPDKRSRLMDEDHLVDADDGPLHGKDSDIPPVDTKDSPEVVSPKPNRFYIPYTWLRALLWRMGVDFLATGLDEVRNRTDVVVDSVTRPSMSSTGFVTFKTLTPVTVITSTPLTYNRNPMEASIAPEPRDLVWENVQIDRDVGASRAFVVNTLLGLGVLLWSIPLTLIQAWAKVENVARIPGLDWVDQIHGGTWKPLINGYLPVITLLGLILLLPLILQWVATSYERRKTFSGVQNSIVGRYFYYQLANIYITVSAGALWTSLAEIIDHPQRLLFILGDTLPKLAGYFISLLLTKILAGLPMVLLRTGALGRMVFLRSCFNKRRLTQRELGEVYRKQPIYYGWEYPTQFLVIIICFTYACITPIVLPVGAVYYFFALIVYKEQSLYVYTPTYESGGRMFPQAVSKTLFALLISQLTFIGYTLIRKGMFQIMLLAPLPFLTVFFTIFIQQRYVEPSKKLSLERAVRIDSLLPDQSPEFSGEAYQQPVLTEKSSAPVCEADGITVEVLENLERLQDETSSQSSRIV